MSQQAATTIGQNLGTTFFRLARIILAHPLGSAVTAALIISIVSVQLFRSYDQAREPRKVEFLSGSFGGSGYELAARLAENFKARSRPFPDVPILLEPTSTDGYEANRARIDRDADGQCIGFGHDGFIPTDNVKVLLPMEYNRLHIIVSEAFYEAARETFQKTDEQGVSTVKDRNLRCVSQIVPFLKQAHNSGPAAKPIGVAEDLVTVSLHDTIRSHLNSSPGSSLSAHRNVFLGPAHSGTRQVAELVMHHYGIPINEIDSQLQLNWNEVFYAMACGDIHMAFIVAEPDLGIIERLAERGGFFLLGLDDADGIAAVHPHIRTMPLERHAYGAMHPEAFCNSTIDMIATRRVIIASSRMNSKDAFYLTTHLREALDSTGHPVRLSIPAGKEERSLHESLIYSVHPGAKFVHNQSSPWYAFLAAVPIPVQTAFWWIVLSFVLYPLANAFKTFPSAGGSDTPPPDRNASSSRQSSTDQSSTDDPHDGDVRNSDAGESVQTDDAIRTLKKLLGKIEASIDECIGGPLDKAEWDRWKRRSEHLRKQSLEIARSSVFGDDQNRDLLHALRVLDSEIEACRPVTSQKSRRKPAAARAAT